MKKTIVLALCLSTSLLSACASSKPQPPAPAPPLFQGTAKLIPVPNTGISMPSGEYKKGEVFAERQVQYTRTGVLKEDAVYNETIVLVEVDKIIPAGTEVYAYPYKIGTSRLAKQKIGWCASAKVKVHTLKARKEVPICMFWSSPTRSSYIYGGERQSRFFAPNLVLNNVFGGTVPNIIEKKTDFGREFYERAKFHQLKNGDVTIRIDFFDGEREVFSRFLNPRANKDGSTDLGLWGGEYKFSPVSKKEKRSINIDIIKSSTGVDGDSIASEKNQDLLRALRIAKTGLINKKLNNGAIQNNTSSPQSEISVECADLFADYLVENSITNPDSFDGNAKRTMNLFSQVGFDNRANKNKCNGPEWSALRDLFFGKN